MNELDALGISQEELDGAEGSAVAEAFKLLESGALKGKVESIYMYEGEYFGKPTGPQMRYSVVLDDSERVLTFRRDLGKHLKPNDGEAATTGKINPGYANALKMFMHATGVSDITVKDGASFTFFGREQKAKEVLGMKGKPVLVFVRKSENTNKAEDDTFRFSNDIEGVANLDGTDASGQDAKAVFETKVAKTPIFKFKAGKKVGSTTSTTAEASASTASATDDF